jgi:NAD(P)-dependent dehydrogenase (short-subunit alcohol dehydrogenase family)
MASSSSTKTILLIGASRGLGYAMAEEYLKHGWRVVGTVRGESRTKLHDLAARSLANLRSGRLTSMSRTRSPRYALARLEGCSTYCS